MGTLVAICFFIAFATSLLAVPMARSLFRKIGLVDKPDANRKLQTNAISLGGGVAVFAAMLIAFIGIIVVDRSWFDGSLGSINTQWYVLFASATAILLVGMADDLWTMRGRQKLLLQILIVGCLVGSGTAIEQLNILGFDFHLGIFSFPVTMLWLLLAINALNLIDGADGMASTAGIVICLGIGAISLIVGSPFAAVVGFGLAGSLLGFLAYNKPPATIYLGDAGSMMIGLFLGVLAIWSNVKESAILASAPIAIFAIPLFDSGAAIMRRWLTGRSIYQTDRAHLHHLLQEKFGKRGMLVVVASLCGLTTLLSVLSVRFNLPILSITGAGLVLSVLILTRSFGHAEARLLLGRTAHFIHSFTVTPDRCEDQKQLSKVPLQGDGAWETVWEPTVDFAKRHDIARVRINLNLPWIHEGYHATWRSVRLPEKANQLSVDLPLFRTPETETTTIGKLTFTTAANDQSIYLKLSLMGDFLADLAPEIERIVRQLELTRKKAPTNQTSIDSSLVHHPC